MAVERDDGGAIVEAGGNIAGNCRLSSSDGDVVVGEVLRVCAVVDEETVSARLGNDSVVDLCGGLVDVWKSDHFSAKEKFGLRTQCWRSLLLSPARWHSPRNAAIDHCRCLRGGAWVIVIMDLKYIGDFWECHRVALIILREESDGIEIVPVKHERQNTSTVDHCTVS